VSGDAREGGKGAPPELKRETVVIFHEISTQKATKISIFLKGRVFYATALSRRRFGASLLGVPGTLSNHENVNFI